MRPAPLSDQQKLDEAIPLLERLIRIDPENAYALRNLASLQQTAHMMPDDERTQFAYAKCLLDLGQDDEAVPILERILEMDPLNEIAEIARSALRQLTREIMRESVGGDLRMDAVYYCLDGMKKFREMGDTKMKSLVYKIEVLGRNGINMHQAFLLHRIRPEMPHGLGNRLTAIAD